MRALEVDMATVQQRLDAGNKAFETQRQATTALKDEIVASRPQAPSASRIVGITLGVIALGGGALWALSAKLSDRPTMQQIESITDKHAASDGHPSVSDDIQLIQRAQTEQRVQSKAFQTQTKKDLEEIKEDVKALRPRSRPRR